MGKRKSPPTNAPEAGIADEGSAEEEEVVVASPTWFPPRPTRPQGSKAAKAELMQQKKREKILVGQARATETMAEASLLKATALQDQCAMSLFTMPMEEGMTDEAKRYFTLRRQEEIHRLERRMRVERRAAELEELEHAKLLNAGNLPPTTSRIRGIAAPVLPVDTPPPPWAPSPNIADSGAASAGETPRDNPVFTDPFFQISLPKIPPASYFKLSEETTQAIALEDFAKLFGRLCFQTLRFTSLFAAVSVPYLYEQNKFGSGQAVGSGYGYIQPVLGFSCLRHRLEQKMVQ